jgi:hypothetical protein
MVAVYPITAGAANIVARPATTRTFLGIYNQSATATVYIAFDTPAVAAATAGQLTLLPAVSTNMSSAVFFSDYGNTPGGALNIIASTDATPVTIIE